MYLIALLTALVMLAPALLYLAGVLRDPFHPLIFIGALSYFVGPDRLLRNGNEALAFLEPGVLGAYQAVGLVSILGLYAGWYLAGRRKTLEDSRLERETYEWSQLIAVAMVCIVVAVPVHLVVVRNGPQAYSGYFRDLSMLWITAAILLVQALLAVRRGRLLIGLLLACAVVPPVERFFTYGQRGDTFRLAALGLLAFLTVARRPSKPLFLAACCGLGIVLASITYTRALVARGDAPNRIQALGMVIPQFISGGLYRTDASDEHVFGAAIVETIRNTGNYGYGLGLTVGLAARFLPRAYFPEKDRYILFSGSYDMRLLRSETGLRIPTGSAPSGFANGFAELGWFCPAVWCAAGIFYRRLWERASKPGRIRDQGLLTGFTMAMLFAVTQDLLTAEVNMVYTMLPLGLLYRFSRVKRSVDAEERPLMAGEGGAYG